MNEILNHVFLIGLILGIFVGSLILSYFIIKNYRLSQTKTLDILILIVLAIVSLVLFCIISDTLGWDCNLF